MYAAMREILRAGQFDAVAPALPASFFCDDFIANQSEQVDAWLQARLRENNHDGSANASQGVDDRDDITDRLGEIKLPTLVAHGTEDVPIEIEKAEELASRIPGAKFLRIDGAGHQSNVDHPAEVTALDPRFPGRGQVCGGGGRGGLATGCSTPPTTSRWTTSAASSPRARSC